MPDHANRGMPCDDSGPRPRHILITQCLQNDFFLNRSCRLCLPEAEVKRLLVGVRKTAKLERRGDWYEIPDGIKTGPLAEFFRHSVAKAQKSNDERPPFYLINIRDWHEAGPGYDLERRIYGPHCARGTLGASYIQGLNEYLDPSRKELDRGRVPDADPLLCDPARYYSRNALRIHHIHSDSLFDFVAPERLQGAERAFNSELTDLMNLLVYGCDDHLTQLDQELQSADDIEAARANLRKLARQMRQEFLDKSKVPFEGSTYVAVIGVYTDIKIQLLLTSLQSRYDLQNLVVSDALTASPTLDRHLAGLDFAAKVLGAEVVHSLDDLLRFLGFEPTREDDTELIGVESYAEYQTYFLDKQSVLAQRSRQLDDYLSISQRRSVETYNTVRWANKFLLVFGISCLALALVGPVTQILNAFEPDIPAVTNLQFSLFTGGLGLLQVVTVFFLGPVNRAYRNLVNLMMMRMILESHSLKTSLARFHLTALSNLPQKLATKRKAAEARRHVALLQQKVDVLQTIERGTYEALRALGFSETEPAKKAEKEAAAADDGKPPPGEGEGPAAGEGQQAAATPPAEPPAASAGLDRPPGGQ